ncbi:MAG TPA: hypothetical protein VFY22_05975 [Hydrogenophaga sp.]|nr:hypothetical protein [Hydrogenophaga sp.]
MDRTETDERIAHVNRNRRFLDHEVQLDRLLALTCGLAKPGRASLELVAPLLWRHAPTNWAQLMTFSLAPAVVIHAVECAEQALAGLHDWSAAHIDEALDVLSGTVAIPRRTVDAVVSVFVLGGQTPLPLAAVLEVFGPAECQARLAHASRVYRNGQLVG